MQGDLIRVWDGACVLAYTPLQADRSQMSYFSKVPSAATALVLLSWRFVFAISFIVPGVAELQPK